MAAWGATKAKAQFSEVLDRAETEGPQLVTRRKREFFVMTRDQYERFSKALTSKGSMAEFFLNSPLRESGIKIGGTTLRARKVEL